MFNGLFAIQTGLDLVYLWGGAELPEGMTHAAYAHRGAYPLIATALLAAAFVLAAMRPNGPGERSPAIRGLVLLWIGQNVLLVVSSMLRLELYVAAYTLTMLRVAAFIWMALVAVGLALIVVRIVLRRSNHWLLLANGVTLAATLYACAFINFPALIATYNVDHTTEAGSQLDFAYTLSLGPQAIPAIDRYLERNPGQADRNGWINARNKMALRYAAGAGDWRAWTFRDWRLNQYLANHPPLPPSNPFSSF
ncbi:DUF4173 domain-containing protein, partial [Vibrio parahaemolyticus]|nr:DUF4173 domain-containing protein [Vibrio parahaemolyticus]